MKVILVLWVMLVLQGCFYRKPVSLWQKDKFLLNRAESFCSDKGGVYLWGYRAAYGVVICFDKKTKYNAFNNEEIK